MTSTCPRCDRELTIDPAGPALVTCPACLAPVLTDSSTVSPVLPLNYMATGGDVEQELRKDLRWAMYGIATFAIVTIVAYLWMTRSFGIEVPVKYYMGAVAIATSIIAGWLLFLQYNQRDFSWSSGMTRSKGTGERVITLFALGAAGIGVAVMMVAITAVVLAIVFVLTCKIM